MAGREWIPAGLLREVTKDAESLSYFCNGGGTEAPGACICVCHDARSCFFLRSRVRITMRTTIPAAPTPPNKNYGKNSFFHPGTDRNHNLWAFRIFAVVTCKPVATLVLDGKFEHRMSGPPTELICGA